MNAMEKLKKAVSLFRNKGVAFPEREAEMIVAHVLCLDRVHLIRDNPVLSTQQIEEIDNDIARRIRGEPLHYIIGYVDFYGLKIEVGEGVLIPRPETELLVDEVLKSGIWELGLGPENNVSPRILDLCTGSGCIALAIAAHMPYAEVCATDISERALTYARENARNNQLENVHFFKGHLYEPIQDRKFHLVLSNPPYIRTSDIQGLPVEIREWEPLDALDAGEEGTRYFQEIIDKLRDHLVEKGRCYVEIGYDQKDNLNTLARQYGFKTAFLKDLSGHDRIMVLS